MNHRRLRVLFAVFFVSGFCGLIYESIWSHYLKLLLGHAAYAQAVVLVVFIGGMALGAWLTGRWSERLRNPILMYAAVEVLVAVVAYGFHLVFVDASNWALEWLLPTMCQAEGLCWASWALAAVLILPPSILLGTTFPLMSAGVLRLGVAPGRGLALLYFLNSAGAALGVLASGFWLIPQFGLPGALLVAGSLNVLVALAAYLTMRWGKVSAGTAAPADPVAQAQGAGVPLFLLVAGLTGLSSFIYEVAWIRMLTQVLGAATHSFELMLASFILGLALGGFWVRNYIDRLDRPERLLAWVQVVMGVMAVATLPLYLGGFDAMAFALRGLARTNEGYSLFTVVSAGLAMAVMLPATICAGMTLPIITAVLLRRGHGERQIGQVYSANTLGAILGVLLSVYLLMPVLGLKWTLAVGALIDIMLGLLLLARFRLGTTRPAWALGGALASLVAALAIPALTPFTATHLASGVFRTGMARLDADQTVILHRDGRTATVTVLERKDGLRSLMTNGKSDGSSYPASAGKISLDDPTVVLLGSLGPMHHARARRAGIIGMGTGITTATLLNSSRIETVETIEIEPLMVEAAQLFRPRNAAAFDDPRSRIVIDDARAHFARSSLPYDLIVSEPSNPWVSGVAGLFTGEFYQLMASKLAPGGHFVQWLHLYEASPQMVGSIIQAFGMYFPEFRVYATNVADIVLVGRADGHPVELQASAFDHSGLRAELIRIGIYSAATLAAHEVGTGNLIKLLFAGQGVPANSDYFPHVDNRAARDRFTKASARVLQEMYRSPVPLLEIGRPTPAYLDDVQDANEVMPPRLHALTRARHGLKYLRGEPLSPGQLAAMGPQIKDYEITRAWLFGCQPAADPELWDSVLAVAGEVNPGVSAQRAGRLWRDALSGRCRARLSKTQVLWLELILAVANRDAPAIRQASDPLLAQNAAKSLRQLEYLVLAAVGSRIALGQQKEAHAIFTQEGLRIPGTHTELPWFRYLAMVLVAQRTPAKPAAASTAPASAPAEGR